MKKEINRTIKVAFCLLAKGVLLFAIFVFGYFITGGLLQAYAELSSFEPDLTKEMKGLIIGKAISNALITAITSAIVISLCWSGFRAIKILPDGSNENIESGSGSHH